VSIIFQCIFYGIHFIDWPIKPTHGKIFTVTRSGIMYNNWGYISEISWRGHNSCTRS